jgi:peptidyl-prolyl cis-trans isomerase D
LRADATALPTLVGVSLDGQGYLVMKVNKVLPRTPPAADRAQQEQAQYAQAIGAAESLAYYELLKERLKVKMKVSKPADVTLGTTSVASR